ncbi:MAG: nucleotidyl transferase AbiEii/AbiGii toxin family protein [Saprospiraceae bacterium]|nr:nucleotidyl transferase AbiEii/AbiGii toxin family protein [Saprospiraceae bacterium]MBP6447433.1 nucleotidyl transferase AbiEii/AbiGii toxin family protein [Saprospiraceae bacterium]
MLHLETVEPGAFSILKRLMALPELQDFHLVGGTALSLMYGHRISVDLVLFSFKKFDNEIILNGISKAFGESFNTRTTSHFGIFGFIDDVKIDIVRFPHPLIRPTLEIDGIRMYSPEEIIAMKVQAILGRGKKKDFWDIAELLQHYTVKDFIDLHKEKYSTQNLYITVPQAIIYFDDADVSENPISLKGQSWKSVKKVIQDKVRQFLV